jgi:vitamin B12 transporter
MRVFRALLAVLVVHSVAVAAEFKVKVIDPQGAAVAGAQIYLSHAGESILIATQTTTAEGIASFPQPAMGTYQIKVLAPGFAEEVANLTSRGDVLTSRGDVVTVRLRIATTSETVVVSATRTPVPGEDAGAEVSTLSGEQLQTMNPVAADDAVRFLPGAIVNSPGRRGALSSLFVRGGNSNYNKMIVDGVSITEPGGTAIYFGTLPLQEADRLEFLRGTQSTLYGSDAMTSVMQIWTRTGSTPSPELRFGADAGNYGTESGYASLAGAHGRFDYNVFGSQFNTTGSSSPALASMAPMPSASRSRDLKRPSWQAHSNSPTSTSRLRGTGPWKPGSSRTS